MLYRYTVVAVAYSARKFASINSRCLLNSERKWMSLGPTYINRLSVPPRSSGRQFDRIRREDRQTIRDENHLPYHSISLLQRRARHLGANPRRHRRR